MNIETRAVEKKRVWPFNAVALLALGLAVSLMGADSRTLLVAGASLLVATLAFACSLQRRRNIFGWLIAGLTLYSAVFFVRFLVT